MDFSSYIIPLIMKGEDEQVITIMEYYDLHSTMDSTQTSFLHYATQYGNRNIAKYLLNKNCPVNTENTSAMTPIITALRERHEEIAEMLLDWGADVTALNRENKSALHYLATEHRLSPATFRRFLQELQKKCATIEEMGRKLIDARFHVYQSIYLGNAELVEYLLGQNLPSNSTNPLNKQSAMHIAVGLNNANIVQLLLRFGADANARNANGITPVFSLCKCENGKTREKVDILKMLLASKVSLTSCTQRGIFQVTDVLVRGTREVIRIILQSDIDFSAKEDFEQKNILHYLAANRNPGVAEELAYGLDKFDLNVVDANRTSPLFFAVIYANADMVKLLLDGGADSNFVQRNGLTPLYYAYKKTDLYLEGHYYGNQYNHCAELLLGYKADPQFLVAKENGEVITIFDTAATAGTLHRIQPIIAHLAMLQAQGTKIIEIILAKINSHQDLKDYFDRCRRVLEKKVFGSITVSKLLNGNTKKISSYLMHKKSALKLKRLSYNSKVITSYAYYYNVLRKPLSKGMNYKAFRSEASKVISNILPDYISRTHLVLHQLVDYFNNEDLCQLYQPYVKIQ